MHKKLVITKMPWKGTIITVAALEEGGRIEELRVWGDQDQEILGNIYLGQVERVQSFMNCAFVRIDKETSCYMELSDQDMAYRPHISEKRPLNSMNELVVQITKEAGRKKNPRVSAGFSLHSPHMVLSRSLKQETGISRKLTDIQRYRLKQLSESFSLPENASLILRTSAAKVSDEQLLAEYEGLRERYLHILHLADTRPVFSVLERAESGCLGMLRELSGRSVTVRTDLPDIVQEISDAFLRGILSEAEVEISVYEDALLPLHKLYRLETILADSLQEKVWLKSGGFLVIQQTDAFVAIDVNSGKYSSKKQPQEIYKKINMEAAEVIVHQLRLRNLSGMILVDFINMKKEEDQEELLARLSGLAVQDPAELTVIDMTALGIVEMTRKKARKPLAEQLRVL